MNEAEAVAIAEKFVIANGYTDLPATAKGSDLSRESIDDQNPEARQRFRANTLQRTAYGVLAENAWSEGPGWTVVFRYNLERFRDDPQMSRRASEQGRAVVMDPNGTDLRMLHVGIALDAKGLKRR